MSVQSGRLRVHCPVKIGTRDRTGFYPLDVSGRLIAPFRVVQRRSELLISFLFLHGSHRATPQRVSRPAVQPLPDLGSLAHLSSIRGKAGRKCPVALRLQQDYFTRERSLTAGVEAGGCDNALPAPDNFCYIQKLPTRPFYNPLPNADCGIGHFGRGIPMD